MRKFIDIMENNKIETLAEKIAGAVRQGEHEGFSPYWKLTTDERILGDQPAMFHISELIAAGFRSGLHPTWELKVVDTDADTGGEKEILEDAGDTLKIVPVAQTHGDGNGWFEVDEALAELFVVEKDGSPINAFRSREDAAKFVGEDEVLDEEAGKNISEFPNYVVIIRAIHERGDNQTEALKELERRGLWLNDQQKRQAGLI